VPVSEEAVVATPFGTLLHFRKDVATPQPRMLVVAPLSGHFATLLRNTVRTRPHVARVMPVCDEDIVVSAGRALLD
jgi:poly-beta-hydroxyalkanoate depolymerase